MQEGNHLDYLMKSETLEQINELLEDGPVEIKRLRCAKIGDKLYYVLTQDGIEGADLHLCKAVHKLVQLKKIAADCEEKVKKIKDESRAKGGLRDVSSNTPMPDVKPPAEDC